MPATQLVNDLIEMVHMIEPDPLWILIGLVWPAWFADMTIHIPLDEFDIVFREQGIKRFAYPVPHIFTRQIQHKLVAPLCTRPLTEMVYPIWMRSIQFTLRIHHLGFNPK